MASLFLVSLTSRCCVTYVAWWIEGGVVTFTLMNLPKNDGYTRKLTFFLFFLSPLDKIFIFPMCVQVAAHAHTFTSSIGQEQKRLCVSVKHSGYKKKIIPPSPTEQSD